LSFPFDESISLKHTCHRCIGEMFLKAEIARSGTKKKCAYCGNVAKGYLLGQIADRVDVAFNTFYVRTSDEMDSFQYRMHNDEESDYSWERDGDPVIDAIAIAVMAENEIAEDIQSVLEDKHSDYEMAKMGEETEFDADSYYTTKDLSDETWQQEWGEFEQSLKSQNRYFNQIGAKHLAGIFSRLDDLRTFDKRPIVVMIGPDKKINSVFRARVFQSDQKLAEALKRPEQHLGPPPSVFANNGRMNARGISVFYGALDEPTALAEVRPPVGSQVAAANFRIVRDLKMLDLTALGYIKLDGSIFDLAYARELARVIFLSDLAVRLTRPVMPDDETFEYLPTQAIADFLAIEPTLNFDGIIFHSAQVEGIHANVILFHKASRVEEINLPAGTESDVRLEEYDEGKTYKSYQVTEWEPVSEATVKEDKTALLFEELYGYKPVADDPDKRPISLQMDIDSLTVHLVKSVNINAEAHLVSRYRYQAGDITDE
jgi:hypothetical protein